MNYQEFLQTKTRRFGKNGFRVDASTLPANIFPWQRKIVEWAVAKGRAAIWADTGLGKTLMQLCWADQVARHTGKPVMILTPLAVSYQTVAEAAKFGLSAKVCAENDAAAVLSVTNYHKLHRFEASGFGGVVLDESSILKSFQGKTKTLLTDTFSQTPFRLACTATPAPNDHLELGNHSDFLGIMPQKEMLARWFVNDLMGNMSWRLKGHARKDFWRWVASWAVVLRSPADLGYSSEGYDLPKLTIHHTVIPATGIHVDGALFADASLSATTLHDVLRQTAPMRAAKVAELVNREPDESWLLWTHTNYESDAVLKLLGGRPNLMEVRGSDTTEKKELAAAWFVGQRCICNHKKIGDKLATLCQKNKKDIGSDTTPSIGSLGCGNLSPTKKQIGKNDARTCGNIARKTERELGSCVEHPQHYETSVAEKSTDQIQNCEAAPNSKSGNGKKRTQKRDSLNDSNHSALLRGDTDPCSPAKGEDATSAVPLNVQINAGERKQGKEDCILTTVTQPELSGAFYAQTAISESVNSATTYQGSSEQSCTCGHRSGSRILLSKPSIFGFGLNFQHCKNIAFVGMDYSYESFYQAVRRCWRFGQTRPVEAYLLATDMEWRLFDALAKKQQAHKTMQDEMIGLMKEESECLISA